MIRDLAVGVVLSFTCLLAGCLSEEQTAKKNKVVKETMECDERSQHLVPKEKMLSVVNKEGSDTLCGVRESDHKLTCWSWEICP